ncbi:hypothetical protein [Marinifilum sp. D737]|uniref:hypothetical protein n=1 Tax=Marinifilum sp. D737 TaxID=2969628 RepID=UPI0022767981|nr:hypothetical protein [Marinifilum sp. D737]MCY1635067.1 hypothetical protein [Marinifilum sp. D737]
MTNEVAICTEDLYLVTRCSWDDFCNFYRDDSRIEAREFLHLFNSFHGKEGDDAWTDIIQANENSKTRTNR